MRVLCTHAGRHGDALWALPAVRAVAETVGGTVDFCISQAYGALVPLIAQQEYIGNAWVDPRWDIRETAPITPAEPPTLSTGYDKVIHLSFRGWPASETMAGGYWVNAAEALAGLKALDLERPWIRVEEKADIFSEVAVGFSDEHFELKWGVFNLVSDALEETHFTALCAPGSRWATEAKWMPRTWVQAAAVMRDAKVFFGCLSAPWVLANALGKRCVVMEPMEARWNPVFWLESHRNRMVLGGDGKPTFDARACVQQVRLALESK